MGGWHERLGGGRARVARPPAGRPQPPRPSPDRPPPDGCARRTGPPPVAGQAVRVRPPAGASPALHGERHGPLGAGGPPRLAHADALSPDVEAERFRPPAGEVGLRSRAVVPRLAVPAGRAPLPPSPGPGGVPSLAGEQDPAVLRGLHPGAAVPGAGVHPRPVRPVLRHAREAPREGVRPQPPPCSIPRPQPPTLLYP